MDPYSTVEKINIKSAAGEQEESIGVSKAPPPYSNSSAVASDDHSTEMNQPAVLNTVDLEEDALPVEPTEKEFQLGMFSGTYISGPQINWADLHVVGEMGAKIDNNNLKQILIFLYRKMKAHEEITGIPGTLEWHPTGAVVTKQVVMLLGESVGAWGQWFKAQALKKLRKRKDKAENVKRDKMAQKLDTSLLPETMAYLRSLKGKEGVDISVLAGMPKPDGIRDLETPEEQMAALEQNMVDGTEAGDARLAQYESAMQDSENELGPSMRLKISYLHLPKMIGKIP